jgi:hypothetical protein
MKQLSEVEETVHVILNICQEAVLNPYTADFELPTLLTLSSLHCCYWAVDVKLLRVLTMLMLSFLMLSSLHAADVEFTSL